MRAALTRRPLVGDPPFGRRTQLVALRTPFAFLCISDRQPRNDDRFIHNRFTKDL